LPFQEKQLLPGVLKTSLSPGIGNDRQPYTTDKRIRSTNKGYQQQRYPETDLPRAIKGVWPLTDPTFVLILENPDQLQDSASRQLCRSYTVFM